MFWTNGCARVLPTIGGNCFATHQSGLLPISTVSSPPLYFASSGQDNTNFENARYPRLLFGRLVWQYAVQLILLNKGTAMRWQKCREHQKLQQWPPPPYLRNTLEIVRCPHPKNFWTEPCCVVCLQEINRVLRNKHLCRVCCRVNRFVLN